MARLLFAWELGTGFGHLVSLRALAQVARRRGHECIFAVRELGHAHEFLEAELGPVLQAPVRLTLGRNPVKTQVSYASLLHNTGFDDPLELAGRLQAWRELFRLLRVDALVAEHSPVAIAAARIAGLPICYVGSGFTVPPALAPFPSFRHDAAVPEPMLAHNDAEVLKELNRALARLQVPAWQRLQDLFAGALPGLLSYEPLDHYGVPRPEPFLGLPDYSHGEAPEWPAGEGPRVFAYLRAGDGLEAMMQALQRSRTRVLVRLSGMPAGRLAAYRRPGLTVIERSVNFRRAAESCDVFVNYAAHSTVAEFLLAGKPGLLMPDLHERVLTARRVVQMGAGVAVRGKAAPPYAEALAQVLENGRLRAAAEGFAARHGQVDRAQILPRLMDDFLSRLPSRAASAAA